VRARGEGHGAGGLAMVADHACRGRMPSERRDKQSGAIRLLVEMGRGREMGGRVADHVTLLALGLPLSRAAGKGAGLVGSSEQSGPEAVEGTEPDVILLMGIFRGPSPEGPSGQSKEKRARVLPWRIHKA
jgi:hypothetical protein